MIQFNTKESAALRSETHRNPPSLSNEKWAIESINELIDGKRDVDEASIKNIQEFVNHYELMSHHKATTVGLFAIDFNPDLLLQKFNNSQSDAHGIEAGDFEKLNDDWIKYMHDENHFKSPFFQIKF